jgi:hypothetical protein
MAAHFLWAKKNLLSQASFRSTAFPGFPWLDAVAQYQFFPVSLFGVELIPRSQRYNYSLYSGIGDNVLWCSHSDSDLCGRVLRFCKAGNASLYYPLLSPSFAAIIPRTIKNKTTFK